jgi:hypothetical protein
MAGFGRADHKAMTLQDLLQALQGGSPAKGLKKPVIMSCDEEGNEMLVLAQVDVDDKTGQVTLWPMHQY